MSSVDLFVGRLPEDDGQRVLEWHVLEELGYDLDRPGQEEQLPHWTRYDGPTEAISLLNLATMSFFTRYAARLEGSADLTSAQARGRFTSLPAWLTSVWLPGKLDAPPAPPRPNYPVFIGSIDGLQEDLAYLRQKADFDLGSIPQGYSRMREDLAGFYRAPFELSNDQDIIRWVWRGLSDGAASAIRKTAPLYICEG